MPSGITFPSKYDDSMPYIGFHARKILAESAIGQVKTQATGNWAWLPVPPEGLETTYQQGWDESTANEMQAAGSQILGLFMGKDGGKAEPESEKGNAGVEKVESVSGTMDIVKARAEGMFGIGGISKRALEQSFISYSGPGYRDHSFSFSLRPRNKTDSASIMALTNFFKFYSAPELLTGGGDVLRLYNVPHVFDIVIQPRNVAEMEFKMSVLTSVGVKYGGDKFNVFSDNDLPTQVDLSLAFKEMEILTQQDFRSPYATGGDAVL